MNAVATSAEKLDKDAIWERSNSGTAEAHARNLSRRAGRRQNPKLKVHRNQVLGSVVSRRLADIISSVSQPSCKVKLGRGTG